jgi:predicted dehydrogenase
MTTLLSETETASPQKALRKPRLGFLGAGWIGRHRLEAVAKSGLAEIAAIGEPSTDMMREAEKIAPDAYKFSRLEPLGDLDLDGLVIATPSALHAEQSIWALERGMAVFCQKPLARTRAENEAVIHAARKADRLLGVDLSYRHVEAVRRVRELIESGALGKIFAVEMVFHNAYGPDKPWFYDPKLSGGGCVVDLGIHLVDLALWWLDSPQIANVTSRLFREGQPLSPGASVVEDYGTARIDLVNGATIKIDCSWKLNAGTDAIISGAVYGSNGGASFRNVNGSFFDFVAESYQGRDRQMLAEPPDAWGGRAIVHWVQQLQESPRFRREIESLIEVASVLDQIYGREEQAKVGPAVSAGRVEAHRALQPNALSRP